MCSSCLNPGGWGGVCGCSGGSVFAVCPASKGVKCPVCDHNPKFFLTPEEIKKFDLGALLPREVLALEIEAFKKQSEG